MALASCVDGKSMIGQRGVDDPRLYAGTKLQSNKRAKISASRYTMFAQLLAEKHNGVETVSRWRRDMQGWLNGKRTISPDKLRLFARAVEVSWIRLFWEVGYFQHLLVVTGRLVDAERFNEAALIAGYTFRDWLTGPETASTALDLLQPSGLFDRALPHVEARLGFWATIPARVAVETVGSDSLRCVLRLCDPADSQYMKDGALRYPCAQARKASVVLLRDLFPKSLDPFNARTLVEIATDLAACSHQGQGGKNQANGCL
jgi:hypothetical protein